MAFFQPVGGMQPQQIPSQMVLSTPMMTPEQTQMYNTQYLQMPVLACRMYCRKRNKHKSLQFIIARIHPLRIPPVLEQPHHTDNHHPVRRNRRTMSEQLEQGLGEYLPGSNGPNSAEATAPPEPVLASGEAEQEDQISLESHSIPAETDIRTANDIKSPPPPYSAGNNGDLPSYEEAMRWSQSKGDLEATPDAS